MKHLEDYFQAHVYCFGENIRKKSQKILLNFVMIKQSPAIRTSKGNPAVLNVNDRH